ncbi:dTDP-4-dehydrorhamnose reductase [Beggiatoa alba]|nr:dTDP-4-dehydrorhamnose reductase [Beggiatoa alba]
MSDALLPDHSFAPKRVLITGANGQVGWELQKTALAGIEVIAQDRNSMDIREQDQINKIIAELSPDIVINAAAYTAVDKAEREPELAFAVNAAGAGYLAKACHGQGVRLIHISTDFVFDGTQAKSYLPGDLPNPLSVYGASKLEGEKQVNKFTHGQAIIIRTAWVYSAHGNNFVKTMLRLFKERTELNVVVDQIGTPTWANGLAHIIWKIMAKPNVRGIFHWADAGVASWYDFAVAIQEEALMIGLLDKPIDIVPIPSTSYPLPAPRPSSVVLDKSSLFEMLDCVGNSFASRHWRASLREMLKELRYGYSGQVEKGADPNGRAV